MKARIKFRKYGALRFIGHLDVMRFFQKVMRRAEIPIAFTGGYSPHMIMSFASPLGIGLTSDGEYFDIELTEAIDSKTAVKRMNEVSIEGIEIISFRKIPDDKKQTGMTILAGADYLVSVRKGALPSDWKEQFSKFMSQPEIQVINEKVFISVKDQGIGIPRESMKKIWERFYKTDTSRGKDKKGTGLGLSIVKEIIASHGEHINAISTEGVGTEFIFTLPRVHTEEE